MNFRIKPKPRTPKEKHKFCTLDCYFHITESKNSFTCSILCLRNEWLQIYINTTFPREDDNSELVFWRRQNGKMKEKCWVKNMEGKQFNNNHTCPLYYNCSKLKLK